MIVPRYWAEAHVSQEHQGRSVTIKRYGWSDVSEDDAQAKGEERAREAMARLLVGERIARREARVPYNGADGMPIREEIIQEHDDIIITRNGYGSLCLNTPDVMFADIDFPEEMKTFTRSGLLAILVVVAFAFVVGNVTGSRNVGLLVGVAGLLVARVLMALYHQRRNVPDINPEEVALERVEAFMAGQPAWNLRVYRTPGGLRLLALHSTFDPRDPGVTEFFDAIGGDPAYKRMCYNQRCFRARVSPKPWRVDAPRFSPRRRVWPVDERDLKYRRNWVEKYEKAANGFAACELLKVLGNGDVHPKAEAVRSLHDQLCRVRGGLPIA